MITENVRTFSHPSGGKRAKNRFIRGDASDALSSGDVLWLSSTLIKENLNQIINLDVKPRQFTVPEDKRSRLGV